jgi:hypothetical protein
MSAVQSLFVGTGDGLAIYRMERGVWRRASHTLAGLQVRSLVALDAETLLAAVDAHPPQQSFDGGVHWSDAPGAAPAPIGLQVATRHGPAPLAYPRLSGATAYARLAGKPNVLVGAGAGGALLFRSMDDGIHWEAARIPSAPFGRITSIIPAHDRRGALWAGADSGALLRSDDAGANWREAAREAAPVFCMAAAGA